MNKVASKTVHDFHCNICNKDYSSYHSIWNNNNRKHKQNSQEKSNNGQEKSNNGQEKSNNGQDTTNDTLIICTNNTHNQTNNETSKQKKEFFV